MLMGVYRIDREIREFGLESGQEVGGQNKVYSFIWEQIGYFSISEFGFVLILFNFLYYLYCRFKVFGQVLIGCVKVRFYVLGGLFY